MDLTFGHLKSFSVKWLESFIPNLVYYPNTYLATLRILFEWFYITFNNNLSQKKGLERSWGSEKKQTLKGKEMRKTMIRVTIGP